MFENQIIKFQGNAPESSGFSIPVNAGTKFYVSKDLGSVIEVISDGGTTEADVNVQQCYRGVYEAQCKVLSFRGKVDADCFMLKASNRYRTSEEIDDRVDCYADEMPHQAVTRFPSAVGYWGEFHVEVTFENYNIDEQDNPYFDIFARDANDGTTLYHGHVDAIVRDGHTAYNRIQMEFDGTNRPVDIYVLYQDSESYIEIQSDVTIGIRGDLGYTRETGAQYTPLLHWDDSDELTTVSCWCDGGDVLGFPFSYDEDGNEVRPTFSLPIVLNKPQYKQEDKTYTKANGEVVTLFAKYYKEWECHTEYLPEAWHDCIVAMLSCDRVYVGGQLVSKSADYEVDWENYDMAEDDIKTARAKFKLRANTNQRNSNY